MLLPTLLTLAMACVLIWNFGLPTAFVITSGTLLVLAAARLRLAHQRVHLALGISLILLGLLFGGVLDFEGWRFLPRGSFGNLP